MTLPAMDSYGNLHRMSGPGGGQFAPKVSAPPTAPLLSDAERLRSRVRIDWRQLLDPANFDIPIDHASDARRKRDRGGFISRGDRRHEQASAAKSFVTNISVPTYTNAQAPVTVVVDGAASGDEVAREYRSVDGQLFRQIWGVEDQETGRVTPTAPATAAWAPTVPGKSYDLRPVPADEEWIRAEAERTDLIAAASEQHAKQIVQQRMDGFAAIEGNVWQATEAPVYRAPVLDDAPFTDPLSVAVAPAPDTTDHAADLGYYPADRYSDAVTVMHATAAATGAQIAAADDEPIRWLRELGLVGDEPEWRQGVSIDVEPSDTLTEGTFRDRLAAFREQIVTIPGAVTGDVGSFLVVGDWKVDFGALTRQQQDEYRRYIMYGVERGLI